MRKRLMLIAAPLCAVAIIASVAGAASNDAEQSRGPKLDKLHAERPIAAMSSVLGLSGLRVVEVGKHTHGVRTLPATRFLEQVLFQGSLQAYGVAAAQVQAKAFVAAAAAAAQAQADAVAAAAVLAATSSPAGAGAAASGPVEFSSNPGDFLSCVRGRESGGDYSVHNQGGSGASGAYQFLPDTWNSIAASVGRTDLVGMDPAQASPGDQDAMAQALYAQQGAAPWGGGCG
jgi:hypothetical protein